MNKLNYIVKVNPIILNLNNLDEDEYIIYANNKYTEEKTPVCTININDTDDIIVEYYNKEKYEFKFKRGKRNLLVIPPKVVRNKFQLEAPMLIETSARLKDLPYLTKFELTYYPRQMYSEDEIPFHNISYFSVVVEPVDYTRYLPEINPETIKLIGFCFNQVIVITDSEVFTLNARNDMEWLIKEIKEIGTVKTEINDYYELRVNYWVKTLNGYHIRIRQTFDYLAKFIDVQEIDIRIYDNEIYEHRNYSRYGDVKNYLTSEEIKILNDIENFRNYLARNLDSQTHFGAELIDKSTFIQKYSEEVYNTLIEAVTIRSNSIQRLCSTTNRKVIRELVQNLDKLECITFYFDVKQHTKKHGIIMNLDSELVKEQETVVIPTEVYSPKEHIIQSDSVVKLFKEDFHFLEDLTKMFEVYNLEDFRVN